MVLGGENMISFANCSSGNNCRDKNTLCPPSAFLLSGCQGRCKIITEDISALKIFLVHTFTDRDYCTEPRANSLFVPDL